MSTTSKINSSHGRRLPIGMEDFTHIRENNFYYVDKTHLIEKLTLDSHTQKKVPGYYFLSRPRRFGKSLMLDTIQCLFEGKKRSYLKACISTTSGTGQRNILLLESPLVVVSASRLWI